MMKSLEPVPERLMSVREIGFLLGQTKATVLARFKAGGDWEAVGLLVDGDYRLPVSAYNAWLAERRLVRG